MGLGAVSLFLKFEIERNRMGKLFEQRTRIGTTTVFHFDLNFDIDFQVHTNFYCFIKEFRRTNEHHDLNRLITSAARSWQGPARNNNERIFAFSGYRQLYGEKSRPSVEKCKNSSSFVSAANNGGEGRRCRRGT